MKKPPTKEKPSRPMPCHPELVSGSIFAVPKRVILFNKPFHVLCQFTDSEGRPTLSDYISVKDVYAA
ncbi:MAG: hypothetical protein WA162_08665, partial [Thermodesulfobacteriota bacterium]